MCNANEPPPEGQSELEIRILRAFLRSEEMRRERFLREMESVRTWQQNPAQSVISVWIADVTLQRWTEELEAVNRSLAKIHAKLLELSPTPPATGNSETASPRDRSPESL